VGGMCRAGEWCGVNSPAGTRYGCATSARANESEVVREAYLDADSTDADLIYTDRITRTTTPLATDRTGAREKARPSRWFGHERRDVRPEDGLSER